MAHVIGAFTGFSLCLRLITSIIIFDMLFKLGFHPLLQVWETLVLEVLRLGPPEASQFASDLRKLSLRCPLTQIDQGLFLITASSNILQRLPHDSLDFGCFLPEAGVFICLGFPGV